MAQFFKINGVDVPCPSYGLNIVMSTAVNSGRNAHATVIGERVGRDIVKYESLKWNYLPAEIWAKILKLTENFFFTAQVVDMMNNQFVTLKMYRGDIKATPYFIDHNTGLPRRYKDCGFNIIDCGVIGEGLWMAENVFDED